MCARTCLPLYSQSPCCVDVSSLQTACPAGFSCPTIGMSVPLRCAQGYFAAASATTCTLCQAGYRCPAGASTQTACGTGYYSATGAITCLPVRLILLPAHAHSFSNTFCPRVHTAAPFPVAAVPARI
ncbi:hypothetical protein EON66_07415 [archaeon]|nr:MAG: hypothetical protein EON66_07415 [archaeon]